MTASGVIQESDRGDLLSLIRMSTPLEEVSGGMTFDVTLCLVHSRPSLWFHSLAAREASVTHETASAMLRSRAYEGPRMTSHAGQPAQEETKPPANKALRGF